MQASRTCSADVGNCCLDLSDQCAESRDVHFRMHNSQRGEVRGGRERALPHERLASYGSGPDSSVTDCRCLVTGRVCAGEKGISQNIPCYRTSYTTTHPDPPSTGVHTVTVDTTARTTTRPRALRPPQRTRPASSPSVRLEMWVAPGTATPSGRIARTRSVARRPPEADDLAQPRIFCVS